MRHRAGAERRNLRLLWLGQFVNTTGLMMLVPVMPFYVRELGVHGLTAVQTWAGAAIAAPALALTVATPLWGRLGDRVGRRWMVVRALVGLALAMAVMAAAHTPLALLAGRLLQGCLGGVVEAAAAFAGSTGPSGKRGSALGKSFSATAAGALVGPLAGGILVGTGGMRELMLGIAAMAVVLAVACALGLSEPPRPKPAHAASRGPVRPGAPRHALNPPRPRLRDHVPGAVPLAAAAVLVYFGVYGLIPVFAEQVTTTAGPSTASTWVGVLQSVTWGATLLASAGWGRHNDRTQRPVHVLAVAAGVCAVAIAAQALPLDPAALIPLRILQGVAFAALAQSLYFHVSASAPRGQIGGAVGSANSFFLFGQAAGPLLAGPFVALLPVPAVITVLAAACGVAAVFAATVEAQSRRRWSVDNMPLKAQRTVQATKRRVEDRDVARAGR